MPEQKVVELATQGRMGNLMFQYAGAYAYARQYNKQLYVSGDLSELQRAFGLKVKYSEHNPDVYSNLSGQRKSNPNLKTKNMDVYDSTFDQDNVALLWGFFQDTRFFERYTKDIRQMFSFKEELSPENKKIMQKINQTNSVSMHIRRGDYVAQKTYHFLLPESYYIRAADYIADRVSNPHFYIFSDDIKWAKENIHLKYPHTFVDANQRAKGYNDMRLMSACKHNIIANSSFSWWGAWLNETPNKIVIMPNVWLNDDGKWIKNIKPQKWVQIQAIPKVAVLYIAIGRYIVFWDNFYKEMEKNFLPDAAVTYFVWTDDKTKSFPKNVVKIKQENLGWPKNTLMRFQMFESQKERLKEYDYIYFMNANMMPVDKIGSEIFPSENQELMVITHPGYYKKSKDTFPYDRNKDTEAYIPRGQGNMYAMGGFNGGTGPAFVKLIEKLNTAIKKDKEKGVMPVWHDESYLNKYILDKNPLVLSPSYGYPEINALRMNPAMKEFQQNPKIIILDKDNPKYGSKNYLRGLMEK